MRVINSLLAATALTLAAPAIAQETADDQPFSGLYIGGTIGYDFQGNDPGERISFDRNLDGVFGDQVSTAAGGNAFSPGYCDGRAQGVTPGAGGPCENDRSRISFSGRAGYDIQFGNIVVGAVAEGGRSQISDFVSAFSTTPANYILTTKIDWNASARLRAGYAADTTLFYGTGGVAYANLDQRFETSNTANAFEARGNDDAWGYTAGGGLEQKIARNISVGVEYLFTDLKTDEYTVRVTRGTAPVTNPFVLAPNTTGTDLRRSGDRLRFHSIRATAALRF